MSNGKDIRKAQKAIKAGKPFVDPYKQDVLYTNMGQWMYPGQVTKIPSNQITMEGVNYPVQGIDDTGYSQMMYPGMDYTFPGQYVTEYPQMQIEGRYQDGGFNTYEADLISKVLMNRNRDKDFVKRAYDVGAYPDSNMFTGLDRDDFGNRMSHKMSWGEDDSGQAYMYPDIYNPNNEAIKVPNQYADYISSVGYKKATGMIPERPFGGQNTKTHTHMANGGLLDTYQVGGLKSVTGPAPKLDAKTIAEGKRIASGYNNANKQNAKISQTRNWSQADQEHSDRVKARINNPASDVGILAANMASNLTRFRNLTPEEIARVTDNVGETVNLASGIATDALTNELVGYGATKAIPFVSKSAKAAGKYLKEAIPKYKNVYRVEPTSFAKDATDQLSGRWFGELEEMPFYINNLKDQNAGVRIMRTKIPVKKWENVSGINMPDQAKLMSAGKGNYNTLWDAANTGEISIGAAKRLSKGVQLPSDINELASNPNLINLTEGILPENLVKKVRNKNSSIFSRSQKVEFPFGELRNTGAHDYIYNIQGDVEKSILGIPRKYFPLKYGGWLDNLDTYQTAGQVINRQDNTRVVIPNLPKDVFNDKNSFEKNWLSDAYEEDENVKLQKKELAKRYQAQRGISKDQATLLAEAFYTNVEHNKSLKESIPESTFEQHVPQDLTSKTLEVLTNPLLAMKQYKGHRLPDHFSSADEDFMSPVNISNLGYQFLTRPGQLAFSSQLGNEAIDNIKEGEYLQAGLNAAFAIPLGGKVIKDAIKYKNKLNRVANIKEIRKVSNYLNKEGALENQGINELDQQYANRLEREHQQYLNQESALENQAINELDQTYIPLANTRQLKSTIKGSPLEKQLSKTGDISVNNIKAHINKAEVGQQDKFMIDKILNERFAGKTKINYNDFKRALSEEIVPLKRTTLIDDNTDWGVGNLGYPPAKKSSYDAALKYGKEEIDRVENLLKHNGNIEPTPWETSDEIRQRLVLYLNDTKLKYKYNLEEYKKLPLENTTVTYGNSSKFGSGKTHVGGKHPENTLGHARTLVSADEPDIMHMLEQQSDYFQKYGVNSSDKIINDANAISNKRAIESINKYKNAKKQIDGSYLVDFGDGNTATFIDKTELNNAIGNLNKGIEKRQVINIEQKEFLGKNHQERLLQENMIYAAEQGKSKMRYPTSETAAKIQGYTKKDYDIVFKELEDLRKGNIEDVSKLSGITKGAITGEGNTSLIEMNGMTPVPRHYKNVIADLDKNENFAIFLKNKKGVKNYDPEHQTILKKYDEMPKMIKKTTGKNVYEVIDPKGNTWYEFDIPESINKGHFEMKAFSLGGLQDLDQEKLGGQRRLKKATSKNIQSSINDLMLRNDLMQRNQTLFGPAGKRRYKPGLKYKEGGWLDQFDK